MRRVTIELDLEEMSKFENNPMLEKVKSLEILQFLKDGPEEFAAIFRIEFEDQTSKVEDFIDDDILELQMLDHEKDGAYIYFIKSKPASHPGIQFDPLAADLPQELGQAGVGRQIDGETAQRLGDRVFRAVGDGRGLPAVEILHDHALQQVVDVVEFELHLDFGVILHLAGAFEESDAGAEQHDPLQGQLGPLGFVGRDGLGARPTNQR